MIDRTAEGIAERCRRAADLTRAGCTAADIGAMLGVTERSVSRYRRRMGLTEPRPAPLSNAELDTAAALLADGCSYNEVARTIGRSQTTVMHYFPGQGWPPGESGRLNSYRRYLLPRITAVAV